MRFKIITVEVNFGQIDAPMIFLYLSWDMIFAGGQSRNQWIFLGGRKNDEVFVFNLSTYTFLLVDVAN